MHQSQIASGAINVGWFDQLWVYVYEVTWLKGNAAIREVKITKTPNVPVLAPVRFVFPLPFPFPFPIFNDPRMDLPAPTGWHLFDNVAAGTQFEFNFPFPKAPPAGPPLGGFIPPLAPAAGGFAPAPPPVAGVFMVYSMENPVKQKAFTTDHLLGQWPLGNKRLQVLGPNHKRECARVTAVCQKEGRKHRYTYELRADTGRVNQFVLFLSPDVEIESIRTSGRGWSTFRPGIDRLGRRPRGEGKPREEERGILFFGSFKEKIGPRDPGVWLSFVSRSGPGQVSAVANNFGSLLVGPVPTRPRA